MRIFFLLFFFYFCLTPPSYARENLAQYCADSFQNKSQCPSNVCDFGCPKGVQQADCLLECRPKACVEIKVKDCPSDTCQILESCTKQKVCFTKNQSEPELCGPLAYSGKVECCKGFIKRCGIEFFDGSCDMEGKNSVYAVPVCLPCGNGICNQFENTCNCPEDCKVR